MDALSPILPYLHATVRFQGFICVDHYFVNGCETVKVYDSAGVLSCYGSKEPIRLSLW